MENNRKQLEVEELEEMKTLDALANSVVLRLGQIEYQQHLLTIQKSKVLEESNALRLRETEFTTKLQNKYGSVNINIDTGEIIPNS